jgi:flagellar biosynthesis protein FliP
MRNAVLRATGILLLLAASSIPVFAADAAQPAAAVTPTVPASAVSASTPLAMPAMPAAVDPNEIRITGIGNGSAPWTIIVLLTFLTLIPSLLLCVTPFARLLVVFHFLRQALGLQTTPTNQTLIGLALILTFFLMQPVGATIFQTSIVPMQNGRITAMQAVERGAGPLRQFMLHYVREKDVALFVELAKEPRPRDPRDLSMRVLVPAYILSELSTGFQIGTVLFLPFLVIDMVVAAISTSVGMLQLPPVVISTPLKLLLFVMVDGWNLLIGSLMKSFS